MLLFVFGRQKISEGRSRHPLVLPRRGHTPGTDSKPEIGRCLTNTDARSLALDQIETSNRWRPRSNGYAKNRGRRFQQL